MALATVIIQEGNGGTNGNPVLTTMTVTNMGIADTANTALGTAYAITAGAYSYEKWQRFTVTVNASGNTIQNLKVWRVGTLPGSDTHKTNANTSWSGVQAYVVPITTISTLATTTMPVTEPTTNLGIGGSITPTSDGLGKITTTGSSDYCIHQIKVDAASTAGPSPAHTMYFQYDEYA
jgi:hypothetical protein